jgi:hypothetical protein
LIDNTEKCRLVTLKVKPTRSFLMSFYLYRPHFHLLITMRMTVIMSNNMSNWNHFKILQKIPEQHIRKARLQGIAANSHNGHSTHTSESATVEAQKSLILKAALYSPLTVRQE